MHTIGPRNRRDRTRRSIHLHPLEEFDVVIDDLLERGAAVVVEVRAVCAAQSGHIKCVPVVLGRNAANDPVNLVREVQCKILAWLDRYLGQVGAIGLLR